MTAPKNPNAAVMEMAVEKLAPLLEKIIFVGGCVTGLLVTDAGAAPVRASLDVDVIAEVASYAEFTVLEDQIRQLGFQQPGTEGAPICRWIHQELILDFMPIDASILGFSNPWYKPALQNAQTVHINERDVRIITAPYFLATKIEAFHGRGKGDFRMSHDLEDIVTILDGRAEIVEETRKADLPLQRYLSDEFRKLMTDSGFVEALPGHLLPDSISQRRIRLVIERIKQLVLEG